MINLNNIKKFNYYLVFMDQKENYITAYGYNERPIILEFKNALEQFSNEEDLKETIPNFENIIDFVCFDVMKYKKFIKYLEKQGKKAKKTEKKSNKKDDK